MKISRITALVISMLLLLAVFPVGMASAGEDDAAAPQHFLSETVDAFGTEAVFANGGATAHGNNQTRLCVTDTGIYMSCPLGEKPSPDRTLSNMEQCTETGLWRINEDGTVTLLFTDIYYGVASGATTNVAADNEGNIWTTNAWEEDNRMCLSAWKWDPKTETMEKYFEKKFLPRGSNYGKPGAIMDTTFNRIYIVSECGKYDKGYVAWFIFDLNTLTWSDTHYVRTSSTCMYHHGFADGKGGFFTVPQNDYLLSEGPSDVEGINLLQAKLELHSYKIDANFALADPRLLYGPNAEEDVAYDTTLIKLGFDVMNGMFAQETTVKRDVYWDTENQLLYVLCSLDDCDGILGVREMIYVYDTSRVNEDIEKDGVFPLVSSKQYTFLYGYGMEYRKKIARDTTGQLYIVAIPSCRGSAEIYALDDPQDPKITFLATEDFRGYVDANSGQLVYGMITANHRNNSTNTGDIVHFIAYPTTVSHWFHFTVDFAALRARLGR